MASTIPAVVLPVRLSLDTVKRIQANPKLLTQYLLDAAVSETSKQQHSIVEQVMTNVASAVEELPYNIIDKAAGSASTAQARSPPINTPPTTTSTVASEEWCEELYFEIQDLMKKSEGFDVHTNWTFAEVIDFYSNREEINRPARHFMFEIPGRSDMIKIGDNVYQKTLKEVCTFSEERISV
jgi:hypothetical protein